MRIMKLLLIGLVFLVSVSMTYAVPEIAYTNFARTAGGGLVLESTVDVRITIFNSGTQVYQEIFTAAPTNGYGLFTVKLGTGAPVGPDTYDALVAVNTLNVQAETDDGNGYRFVQLSPLLNTALKNEEAAGIVTLNDAYLNGDSIEVLPGAPITLTGTGLIQSDATIAAINANGNKTLTTKEYVDNGIANVADNPFLVYQDASAELPNSKILNGETNVIDFNAATATLSILNDGISEPKLKMANDPLNGYVIKWNGTDMTWVDPTVITAAPVSGDGTAGNPITLDYVMPFILNGVNLDLEYDATLLVDATNGLGINLANPNSWTGTQTFATVDINGGTIDNTVIGGTTPAAGTFTTLVVNTTADIGTDLTVGGNTTTGSLDVTNDATVGGNLVVTGTTTSALFIGETNFDIQDGAGIADFTFNNLADAVVSVDYDATLKIDGADKLGIDLDHSNTWTADQYLPATNTQGNNLVDVINEATDMTLEADVLMYDATLEVNSNELGFNHDHQNTWLTTQSFIPTADEIALLVDGTNATSGYALLAVGSDINDGITDFYYEGDSYQEGFAYFTNSSTTNTTFGVQVTVAGEATTIPTFPTVAQGVTAVASYSGAAPSTDMVIGNVGLAYAGNGIIAIGSYGGARDENNVANVGVVGHAFNDAAGLADINHGVFGMVSQTVDGAAEIGTALSLDLNSGVTGINLGTNANDWAAYFIGKVNVTGNLTANDLDVITTATVGTDLTVGGDATVSGLTTTNTLDVTLTANVGTDLTVGNDATIGNDLDVVGNTTTNTLDVTLTANVGTDLTVGNDASIGNDLDVVGNTTTGSLDVTNDANVGGNLVVTGTTTSALFIGETNFDIQDGAGIADFTFNNLADAVVSVDYDATLKIDGTDKLGFNHENMNEWLSLQTFAPNSDEPAIAIDGTNGGLTLGTPTLVALGNGISGDDDFIFEGQMSISNNLIVTDNTSTGSLDVDNDATVGGNLDVTGTTTSALFIGETNFDIQDGAGIADFTFNNLGDAIVAVDYDATLKIDGADKLGLDLGHENTWTITQNFTTVNASNDVIAADKVEGKYLSTTNYLNPAAGGVRIGEDDANLNGWLKFKNAGIDVIELGETADDGYYGIRVNDNAGNFRTGLGWDETLNTWGIGTGDGTDFVGLNFTTNNTDDESRLIVLNNGVPVFNVDAEGDVSAGTVTATTFNGGFGAGAILFADATGNIDDNNINLLWDNANSMMVLDGSILIAGVNGNYGIDIQGGDGINLAGGNATLTINDYKYPVATGAATEFMALNATTDELEWWNYDNTILVDDINKTIGVDMSAPFTFTNLVAFNPASGSAISASSSDPSAPTVTIAHTDPLGVALELVGQNEETTALEITTGGINIGAGQFIVSSNSGLTGAEPNGPSITINNNGDTGGTENGGALEILIGHTAFSYTQVADQADLSDLPYTVIEITLTGNLTVTNLPESSYGAEKNGTIIYIVNPDAVFTITLPGTLGNIAPKAAAQLVYTAAGWIRIN